MTSAKHCIGVIGLGSIGRRHATNLYKELGQTEVIGYDPDLDKNVGWVIGDLDKLIKMASAIVIASPTHLHNEHALSCMGKPSFMEKPIADSLPVIGTPLMVGYNLRFHPCVIKAKEWINAGDIGEPVWANFTLGQRSEKPPYLRDGVILNWSHEIDLCLYLLGNGSVSGSSTRLSDGRDDISDILFTHTNGCRSTIHLDYRTEPEVRQSIIVGNKATVIVDLVSHNAWLRDKDSHILEHAQGVDWDYTYIEEMRAFLARLDGKQTLGCTAEEGLEVLKVCLEVRKRAGL